MSFGSLGATSGAAVDTAGQLLKVFEVMSEMPNELVTQLKALLQEIATRQAELLELQKKLAEQQAALEEQQKVIQAKQDALDEHIAKIRKLTE
jgi:chromosome segregation ATPase